MARSKDQIHQAKKRGLSAFGKVLKVTRDAQTGQFLVRNATALGGTISTVPGIAARGFHDEQELVTRPGFANEEPGERSQNRFWAHRTHVLNWSRNSRPAKGERIGKAPYPKKNELVVNNAKARKFEARVEQLSAELRLRRHAETNNEFAWPNDAVDAVAAQVITPVTIDAPTMELMSRKPRWGRV